MLPDDAVSWTSGTLVGMYLLGAIFPAMARRRKRAPRAPRTVKASRPLTVITGTLWEILILSSLVALVLEVAAPGWVYGGPLAVHFPGDIAVQILGPVVWIVGGALVLWAGRTLGRHVRVQIEVSEDHELITEGPYRRIRHPMYTALLLINLGATMLLLNAAMALATILTYSIALRRALQEEQLLASPEAFGDVYRAYMTRTGRFLPRMRSGEPRATSPAQ